MTRRSRRWPPLVSGMLIAAILAALAFSLLTRTSWGKARILAFTLRTLGGQLNGTLAIDRLDGNLFTGARVYRISIDDENGQPLLEADSAWVDYRLPTLLSGDVNLSRVVLFRPRVFLARLPGDSLWNYQHVLLDTTAVDTTRNGRATLIDALRLVDAAIQIRIPWTPSDSAPPRLRAREVREALADSSRVIVDSVPGGYLRTMRFDFPEARIANLIVAGDRRGGTSLRVEGATGTIALYRGEPLRLTSVEGELGLDEGIVRYRAPAVVLPASRLSAQGVVDISEGGPKYDMRVEGTDVALNDLKWLDPGFPDEGDVQFSLGLESHPEGLLFSMTKLTLTAPGTNLAGHFGIVMGDTLRFTDVDLTADPLNVETVEQMLPSQLPVRGLHIGAVQIHSPAS